MKFVPRLLLVSAALWMCVHVCDAKEVLECSVDAGGCSYNIKVFQQQSCSHSNNTSKDTGQHVSSRRTKRSTMTESNDHTNVEIDKLRRRMIKLEKKLSKAMEDLSTRVLRSVRKIEKQLENGAGNGPDKRHVIGQRVSSRVCPERFEVVDNWSSCYMFSNFNATWYEAKEYCAALNSELLALGTIKEHILVSFLLKNNLEYSGSNGWWTGGTFVAKTKQWIWISDIYLRPFTFIKWAKDEPNENVSPCVYLSGSDDHMWHDDPCSRQHNFICEISSESG